MDLLSDLYAMNTNLYHQMERIPFSSGNKDRKSAVKKKKNMFKRTCPAFNPRRRKGGALKERVSGLDSELQSQHWETLLGFKLFWVNKSL